MRASTFAAALTGALFALPLAVALGDTAVSANADAGAGGGTSTVYVEPFIVFLKPYIDVIVQSVAGLVVVFAAGLLQKYTNVQISQTALDKLRAAAATQAGVLVAAAENNLAHTTITTTHPLVVAAANRILAMLPEAAAVVGATPEALSVLIVGEIGKLQAQSAAAK